MGLDEAEGQLTGPCHEFLAEPAKSNPNKNYQTCRFRLFLCQHSTFAFFLSSTITTFHHVVEACSSYFAIITGHSNAPIATLPIPLTRRPAMEKLCRPSCPGATDGRIDIGGHVEAVLEAGWRLRGAGRGNSYH